MSNPATSYDRRRDAENTTNLLRSRLGRDIIAGYPLPGDPERRAACERDFRCFCKTYFPAAFSLPWSDDHLRVILRIQSAVLGGGLFALAMPRGSGKTTLCERAALWALLYRHRRFVCLIGATAAEARCSMRAQRYESTFGGVIATTCGFDPVLAFVRPPDGMILADWRLAVALKLKAERCIFGRQR